MVSGNGIYLMEEAFGRCGDYDLACKLVQFGKSQTIPSHRTTIFRISNTTVNSCYRTLGASENRDTSPHWCGARMGLSLEARSQQLGGSRRCCAHGSSNNSLPKRYSKLTTYFTGLRRAGVDCELILNKYTYASAFPSIHYLSSTLLQPFPSRP